MIKIDMFVGKSSKTKKWMILKNFTFFCKKKGRKNAKKTVVPHLDLKSELFI